MLTIQENTFQMFQLVHKNKKCMQNLIIILVDIMKKIEIILAKKTWLIIILELLIIVVTTVDKLIRNNTQRLKMIF